MSKPPTPPRQAPFAGLDLSWDEPVDALSPTAIGAKLNDRQWLSWFLANNDPVALVVAGCWKSTRYINADLSDDQVAVIRAAHILGGKAPVWTLLIEFLSPVQSETQEEIAKSVKHHRPPLYPAPSRLGRKLRDDEVIGHGQGHGLQVDSWPVRRKL